MIPTEIVVDILLRLPVDSLLRCKSVCKLWCSLISDPHFVKSHLSLATSNNHYVNSRLIFSTRRRSAILKTCGLNEVLHDDFINVLEVDHPLKDPYKFVRIIDSCNGLICIEIKGDGMVIWNPTTSKYTVLPDFTRKYTVSRDSGHVERRSEIVLYGFGYEEYNDDYKLVQVTCVRKNGIFKTCIKICSLKTGSWKEVGVFPLVHPLMESGKFLNGALHWAFRTPSKDPRLYYSWTIYYVNLAKETYGEVLQPVYDEGHRNFTLGTLREWLCVLCNYRGIRADVWVMKVYGVKDSWTKLVSIPYLTDPGMDRFSVPLCISNDGKILLKFREKLTVYDSKNRTFTEVQSNCKCAQATIFVESLVSPPMLASGLGDRS